MISTTHRCTLLLFPLEKLYASHANHGSGISLLGFTVFTSLLFFAMTFWQEGRIDQCRVSDIKYHYIMMHNGINSVGLDSLESWFHDPDKVGIIESEVRDYEERVQETARALDQKHRLEQKINELNSQNQNSKK